MRQLSLIIEMEDSNRLIFLKPPQAVRFSFLKTAKYKNHFDSRIPDITLPTHLPAYQEFHRQTASTK